MLQTGSFCLLPCIKSRIGIISMLNEVRIDHVFGQSSYCIPTFVEQSSVEFIDPYEYSDISVLAILFRFYQVGFIFLSFYDPPDIFVVGPHDHDEKEKAENDQKRFISFKSRHQ